MVIFAFKKILSKRFSKQQISLMTNEKNGLRKQKQLRLIWGLLILWQFQYYHFTISFWMFHWKSQIIVSFIFLFVQYV